MIEAYVSYWKNYVNFDGRSRRSDFWWAMLCSMIVSLVLSILTGMLGNVGNIIYMVFMVANILPALALAIRRLHDIDKSGWNYLLMFIPLVGAIIVLVFYCKAGTPGSNRYGEDPKAVTAI